MSELGMSPLWTLENSLAIYCRDKLIKFRSPDRDGRKKKRGANYDEWYVLEGRRLKAEGQLSTLNLQPSTFHLLPSLTTFLKLINSEASNDYPLATHNQQLTTHNA